MSNTPTLTWAVFVNDPPLLRAGASVLYGVREHPGEHVDKILVTGWL